MITPISKSFRESNNTVLQELGAELYVKYIFKLPENLKRDLAKLNTAKLRAISPHELSSLPEITGEKVAAFFKNWMNKIEDVKDWSDSTADNAEKENIQRWIEANMLGKNVSVGWAHLDNEANKKQITIGLQHFVKALEGKDEATIKTYVLQVVAGFRNCQTRQAMEPNNALVALGVFGSVIGSEAERVVYQIINEIKQKTYNSLVYGDGGVGVHNISRYFTVIKARFGLPVSLKNFEEKISKVTDEDILEIMGKYLAFFNDESIIQMFKEKAKELDNDKDSKINYYYFRNIYLKYKLDAMGIVDLFNAVRGEDAFNNEDYEKISSEPLNENEIRYLLEKMGILNTKYHEKIAAKN